MGGCQSKPASSSVAAPNSTHADTTQARLRDATDPPHPESNTQLPQKDDNEVIPQQWSTLFATLAPYILDPADLPSTLDAILSATINILTPVEISYIKRRVRRSLRCGDDEESTYKGKVGGFFTAITNSSHDKSNGGYTAHSSLEEERSYKVSKGMFQRERLMDVQVLRRVFEGGQRTLRSVKASVRESDDVEVPKRRSLLYAESMAAPSTDREAADRIDVYGSAYLLLSYMAESRWDYLAQIARLSAERAGLVTDVNELALLDATIPNNDRCNGRKTPPPPPPPSFEPPSQTYNIADLTAPEPNGISFPSLCYLIAMALRGSRRQKLNLLFFLLLPPRQLDMILASHPAGGLPSWILEMDGDVILSYDSLGFYHHYEGVMLPFGNNFGSECGSEEGRKSLTIDASSSVEFLSALIVDYLVGCSWGEEKGLVEQGCSYGMGRLRLLVDESDFEENAENLIKCEGVKELLQEGNSFNPPSPEDKAALRHFLESTSDIVDVQSSDRTLWSMKDFVEWAEVFLNDSILYKIMHHLFGSGILPTPTMERKLIAQRWLEWNIKDIEETMCNPLSVANSPSRGGFRNMFIAPKSDTDIDEKIVDANSQHRVWGGIGGFDGKGGLGHGVLYCIDRQWWDEWVAYTGFGNNSHPSTLERPRELSTERLLDRSTDSPFVAGTRGSYELMRVDISVDDDYILVPPGVWNELYNLYGGGPPLPRMILPDTTKLAEEEDYEIESVEVDNEESVPSKISINSLREANYFKGIHVPVATHPWIIHCQVCDPQQPYRRGEAGALSIRIQVLPEQPLWRLFAEVVYRLPICHPKSRDSHGEGRARLWRFETSNSKTSSRYGPWALLCKNRFADIPINSRQYVKYEDSWREYADQHSVESAGLSDEMHLMYEYALANREGMFSWPREAAAKFTRLRHIADEDAAFRLFLRGLDSEGKPSNVSILNNLLDAMDSSGRWYQALIISVNCATRSIDGCESGDDHEHSDTASDQSDTDAEFRENTFVRIRFSDHAGNKHEEWIDVNSDRLAVRGRFTAHSVSNLGSDVGIDESAASETKARLTANKKKDSNDATANESLCLFPSYGACGLVNLGNTCYANSGLQCIAYLPLLRAYLLSGQFKICGDLNRDNPLGTGGRLLEEFAELMHIMWSGKFGTRAPHKFRGFLGKCRPQYSGADQQDAQELINDMIDMLHEDGNRVKKKPCVAALEDKFIEKTELHRVGQESWRRFLRRNRSAISDLSMGQVYNRVTCPVCNHSSKNFDPFNMLSLPFPTVAEVVFHCTVVRRATIVNCPNTLQMVNWRRQTNGSKESLSAAPSAPSKELIFEEYIIEMSRLADIGDLKMKLQNISGITSSRFRICKMEDIPTGNDESSASQVYHKVSALPEKEGPCVKLLHQVSVDDSPMVAKIVAFEATLNSRPVGTEQTNGYSTHTNKSNNAKSADDDVSTAEEGSDDSTSGHCAVAVDQNKILEQSVHDSLKYYGDDHECVLFDTNPTSLSKYVSRCLWPKSAKDFTLGLRVDAIDHRNNWFPGSVIEIIDSQEDPAKINGKIQNQQRVKVHFDNFSTKWDETYSIDSFVSGRVCPLYSHATPRSKATEFLVHHRSIDKKSKKSYLFGQSFYLQCHNEWSTARAGAHILAQASRFLESSHFANREDENLSVVNQKLSNARKIVAMIIEALLTSDKKYIQEAIESGRESKRNKDHTPFDASIMSKILIKKLNEYLSRLPFDIRVTTADSPLGSNQEETAFPFSLVRTIGNYMNARHSLVLHWRVPSDNTTNSKSVNNKHPGQFRHVLYSPPTVAAHESMSLLNRSSSSNGKSPTGKPPLRRHPSSSHGGMPIGICLNEFCKEQRLGASDSWRCPVCKVEREGKQSMSLWNLPDLLTFHLKRFSASSRWREKITTKVDFPLTGLNMREWCDNESPLCRDSDDDMPFIYDLIGVVNHFGGMTGGHYVAMCKATACSPDGVEDVAYTFNGLGAAELDLTEEDSAPIGWRLGRPKEKDLPSIASSKVVAESAEPLWLQFDDDLVEPLPPHGAVSETAYVLFYRRRQMHSANVAKYSVLE